MFMYFFLQRKVLKSKDMAAEFSEASNLHSCILFLPPLFTAARPVKMMEYHPHDLITHRLALSSSKRNDHVWA